MTDDTFLEAPCANFDDPDAWFVNRRGRLDPEDRREIEMTAPTPRNAEIKIEMLEKGERARLRRAIRSCYYDCPMATRLACLSEGLEEPFGVRGGYTADERLRMVDARDEYELTGRRVAEIAISADRREALETGHKGDDSSDDQSPESPQPRDESIE